MEINVGFGFTFLGCRSSTLYVVRHVGEAWFMFTISSSDLVRLSHSCERNGVLPTFNELNYYACGESKDELICYFLALD